MTPSEQYLEKCGDILESIRAQRDAIEKAADWFAETIQKGRMVHMFGAGHSRIMVEEMWPRYGSFPGFNPIVELSMTFHHPVVGSNGQRQAMFLENVAGVAERILRNFDITAEDSGLVVSSSGCNVVPIEIAEGLKSRGVRIVAIVSKAHADASTSNHPSGQKLSDVADIALDTGAPAGDAVVRIEGLETPVAPGSTIGGCALINCLKAEIADRLTKQGSPPRVLTASALIGKERSNALFDAAYDEHARRLAKLYAHIGEDTEENG